MNEKNIFLFDGSGALFSAFVHGLILPFLVVHIGLPVKVHYLLALIPIVYALYSFFCYFKVNHKDSIWLSTVIAANSLYCILTAIILIVFWQPLMPLGIVYFAGEFVVIFFVIFMELRVLKVIKSR